MADVADMTMTIKVDDQASGAIRQIRKELDKAMQSPRPPEPLWLAVMAVQGLAWFAAGWVFGWHW